MRGEQKWMEGRGWELRRWKERKGGDENWGDERKGKERKGKEWKGNERRKVFRSYGSRMTKYSAREEMSIFRKRWEEKRREEKRIE
jgi:hypothetical protein